MSKSNISSFNTANRMFLIYFEFFNWFSLKSMNCCDLRAKDESCWINSVQFSMPHMWISMEKRKCNHKRNRNTVRAFKLQQSELFDVIVWYRFHFLHATRIVIINSWYENIQADSRYCSRFHTQAAYRNRIQQLSNIIWHECTKCSMRHWKFDRFPFVLLYEYHNRIHDLHCIALHRIACVVGILEKKTSHTQNNSRWNSQMNASTVGFLAGRSVSAVEWEHRRSIGETSGVYCVRNSI